MSNAVFPVAPGLNVGGLRFAYPDTPEQAVIDQLSATLRPGVTLVRGGDGRGKTTLLRLLAGDLTPTVGQLHWQPALAERPVAFWTDPRSDAHDALPVPAYFDAQRRRWAGFDDAVLADLLVGLGLNPHGDKQIFMLSTGTKRKVFLAAALASGALLTLIDEPFAALDGPSIRCVTDALHRAAAHPTRLHVVADYSAPPGVALSQVIDLGD